jgi:acyl-CoA thioesterase
MRFGCAVEKVKDGHTTSARHVRLAQDGKLRVTTMVLLGMPGEGPHRGAKRAHALRLTESARYG